MLPDSPLEYQLHPGVSRENVIPDTGSVWTYQINSEGFRGDDFDVRDDRKRVLFIGDSYTFGWGVGQEDVLTRSVERVLAKPPYKLRINAYNLGVPGYNTVQEYHLLTQVLDQYAPSLVVLGYVMNDAQPQHNVHVRPSIHYKYVASWLLAFVRERINYHIYENEPVLTTGVNAPDADYLGAVKENAPKWAAGRQAFEDMVSLCKSRNIPFLVVIFPSYNMPFADRYPFRRIHTEVSLLAENQGVKAVDILPFLEKKDYREFRVEGDGHPNARAFKQTAEILAPLIYEYLEGTEADFLIPD
jgi:lysophospholipase L1-like esterase